MKCSACSEVVKPVVAIDIDGTIGDYHGHFWDFARQWLDVPFPDDADPYRGQIPYRVWFQKAYGIDTATFRSIKLAYRQGGLKRSMPVYPGAADLVRDVRALGAEVWLTTTRPHDRYDRVDPDTREWLRRNVIEADALLFGENKLNDLYDRVDAGRVVAVLDDQESVLEDAYSLFGVSTAILRRTLWNSAVHWPQAVEDLGAARLMIQAKVEDWRRYKEIGP